MGNVKINVDVRTWITQYADPDDQWDNDNTAGEITSVSAVLGEPNNDWDVSPWEVDVKAGDTVYAVVALYSSGDTFGNYGGETLVLNVFTDKEKADALRDWAETVTQGSRGSVDYSWEKEFDGAKYRIPWFGYFESLDHVTVYECTVGRD